MSLYNLLFGANPFTKMILTLIDLDYKEIERFRDCGLEEDRIWIYTRTGGANREGYPNKILTKNPNYFGDRDDNFDDTYAMYEFSIPEDAKESASIIRELMVRADILWDRPNWKEKFKNMGVKEEDLEDK